MKIPRLIFFFILAIFPLGQLGRFPIGKGEVVLHLNDLMVGFLVLTWFIWHLTKKRKIIFPPLAKPIFLFIAISFLTYLLNGIIFNFGLSGSLYLARWAAYAGLYFVVYELVSKKEILPEKIFRSLILVGITVGSLGILQYFFYPDLRNLYYLGWDPHYFRVFSTFFDPTFTGAILVLTLIALVTSFWKNRPKGLTWWWFLVAVLTVYSAFALTYSRSSYLAFLVGMGTLAYLKRAPKFFLITLLIFALTLVILPKREDRIGSNLAREDTIKARIINWQQSLEIIKDNPLLGVGFNNYRQVQKRYGFTVENGIVSHASAGADSSLLFIWATTGIFGLLVYLWLGIKMIKLSIINNKSSISIVLLSSITALIIHSFFSNSLFYPWIMEWVWILAAIVSVKIEPTEVRPR